LVYSDNKNTLVIHYKMTHRFFSAVTILCIMLSVGASIVFLPSCNYFSKKQKVGKYNLFMKYNIPEITITSEIDTAVSIIKNRYLKYGIPEENISIKTEDSCIVINISHADNPERILKLTETKGKLEFWKTWDASDVYTQLESANKYLAELYKEERKKEKEVSNTNDLPTDSVGTKDEYEIYHTENPLFSLLYPNLQQDASGHNFLAKGPNVGYAKIKDTASVNKMLQDASLKRIFKQDLKFLWEIKPYDDEKSMLWLIAIKIDNRNEKPALDGTVITDAEAVKGESGINLISMKMNPEGAEIWKQLTGDNIGKSIAIVLDDYVYSYPIVQGEIPNGASQISGNFTAEEAEDMAVILSCGKLPGKLNKLNYTLSEEE
jgi:SecD/SecF fusion protein